ncbi:MAG: hypothetical protein ACYS18_11140 [Planctomycetota bacterium]|jgi:hypothetical protein
MGVYESGARIKRSIEDMNIVWGETKAVWKDAKSREFEEEFLMRLSVEVKKAETALGNIGPILNRIRSELKD